MLCSHLGFASRRQLSGPPYFVNDSRSGAIGLIIFDEAKSYSARVGRLV
jgi:hypothetical protein